MMPSKAETSSEMFLSQAGKYRCSGVRPWVMHQLSLWLFLESPSEQLHGAHWNR